MAHPASETGGNRNPNTLLHRWAQSRAATAAVISTTLIALVTAAVGLGVLAVLTLGPLPGIAVTLLVAALTIGPGVIYVDKKLTP